MSCQEEITSLMVNRDKLQDLTQTILNTLNKLTNIKITYTFSSFLPQSPTP